MASALRDKVVVITGASSGIGRATAIEFARSGARVALAARAEEALEETARLCREAGGNALVVVTDVTCEADVQSLARRTMEQLGPIDVWVNNAGVTLFGFLSEASIEDERRVIETNVFGPMYGARAVIPHFKAKGRGILVNVGSILSKVGQPFVPTYVISKFAVSGLSEALRAELAEYPDIHVCSIYPFVVDTPHFEAGANQRGRHARAIPPMQSPEKVARAIVNLAIRPRREVYVPRYIVLGLALHELAPNTTERLLLRTLHRWHFDEAPERPTKGNLYEPAPHGAGRVHGRRPAQLGNVAFAAWVLRELGAIVLGDIPRVGRRWLHLSPASPPASRDR
jgi:NAD(P)-dependent dehydrogenase (short-subunit alcohol dehydrogenase family)